MARCTRLILLCALFFLNVNILSASPRVISLYPGHSDNIFALGGADCLIALSENDDADFLPELPRIPLKASPEKLLALKPDIIITRSMADKINPSMRKILTQAGVKVVILDPPQWNDFNNYLIELADIIGADPEQAIKKFERIKNDLVSKIPANHKNLNVFIEATSKEIHTCSPDSWAANLIKLLGANNTAHDAVPLRPGSSIAAFGVERVLKSLDKNLDVYIIQNGAMNNSTLDDFFSRAWSGAFKNVKIFCVPEKFLSRPSLIGLEHGGEMLIKILYRSEY